MYNQPSDPYNQQQYGPPSQPYPPPTGQDAYDQYGQRIYPQSGPEQAAYSQQQYEQPRYPQYGQQVPPYAQAQPQQYNIQVGYGVMEPQKDWLTTLLLCIFLGVFGVHRFYTGHVAIGLVQLFTAGGCGIWVLIDLIMIATNSYTDNYGRPLLRT